MVEHSKIPWTAQEYENNFGVKKAFILDAYGNMVNTDHPGNVKYIVKACTLFPIMLDLIEEVNTYKENGWEICDRLERVAKFILETSRVL